MFAAHAHEGHAELALLEMAEKTTYNARFSFEDPLSKLSLSRVNGPTVAKMVARQFARQFVLAMRLCTSYSTACFVMVVATCQ